MLFLHTLQTFYKQNVWKPYENNSSSSIHWKELAVSCPFITKVNIYLYFLETKPRQTVCKGSRERWSQCERWSSDPRRWDMWVLNRPRILICISSLTKAGNKSILILTSNQSLLNKIFITYFCNFLCTFCAL